MIHKFTGEFTFLSNFYPSTLLYRGHVFKTAEHAYQASKCSTQSEIEVIKSAPTPVEAKKLGKSMILPPGWDEIKIQNMREIIKSKFENPFLRERLKETGHQEIRNENSFHEKFWGTSKGEGLNWFGVILMDVRREIFEEDRTL